VAVYDPESKKLVVRVVYDGPGMAGKTTNLQQICTFFTLQKRSELYSGRTAAERTLCLDWLQLDGGLVRGHDLRCHLLTVPGQAVLSRRRQMLLTLADVAVFVVDSSEPGLKQALSMWRSLLACTGGPGAVPLVIQANKQDQPGALTPVQIREQFNVDASVPVVPANASSGQGVRETIVLAIRAAALLLQDKLSSAGVNEIEGTYESGQELERRILEMERSNPMLLTDAVLAARAAAATPAPAAPAPTELVSLGLEPPAAENPPAPSSPVPNLAHAPTPSELPTPAAPAPGVLLSSTPPAAEPARVSPAIPARAEAVPPTSQEPPLPSADVPTGLVWPALEGRRTLRRIPFSEAVRHQRSHPANANLQVDDNVVFEAGIWCLRTNRRRRFSTVESAREELMRLAHTKLDLGTLCAPRTVLAVQHDADGGYWLWNISIWLTTLENELERATRVSDDAAVSAALGHFARVTLKALKMCVGKNMVLDVHPRNFGVLADEVFYLDEVEPGQTLPGVGHTILHRFDEYSRSPEPLSHYREILEQGFTHDFSCEEIERLDLLRSLGTTIVSTEAGRRGRADLIHTLSAMRASAR
jgi:signal recognition particle receptor subunit beta